MKNITNKLPINEIKAKYNHRRFVEGANTACSKCKYYNNKKFLCYGFDKEYGVKFNSNAYDTCDNYVFWKK